MRRIAEQSTASLFARFTRATKKSSILATRIIGRVSCETIADPVDKKKKIVKANQLIDEKIAGGPAARSAWRA